jgi:hypothetical protein
MKKIIASLMLVIVMVAGLSAAQAVPMRQTNAQSLKGYITIGNSVVMLPTQLQAGDRIVFTKVTGAQVYSQRLGDGFFRMDVSRLRPGLYVVSVFRNGTEIAAIRLPFQSA